MSFENTMQIIWCKIYARCNILANIAVRWSRTRFFCNIGNENSEKGCFSRQYCIEYALRQFCLQYWHPSRHGTLSGMTLFPAWYPSRHGTPWLGTPSSSAPRIRPSFHNVNKSRGGLRIVSFENGTSFLMRSFAVTSNEALESLWASF